jgi:hypothetical protein
MRGTAGAAFFAVSGTEEWKYGFFGVSVLLQYL